MNDVRLPPNDNDSEEATVGSLLMDGTAIFQIANFLKSDDFYFEQNRLIYESCIELYKRGVAINNVTLAQELARVGKLETVGGTARLSYLVSVPATSLDIEHYARIVYRLSIMRQIITAGDRISAIGYESGVDENISLAQAEAILFQIRGGEDKNGLVLIHDVLDKYFEAVPEGQEAEAQKLPVINSGFRVIDDFMLGFRRSNLIIVAGRPSMGKTSLALNIARNTSVESRACVALFSLEMSREEIAMRLVSSESNVNSRTIERGLFGENEQEEKRIIEAVGVLSEAPLYIDDSPIMRMADIRSRVLRLSYERPVDLVVVDYLQLIQGENLREGNRVQEISRISRDLKALAREAKVPVIAVSQLSRAVEGRASHEPQLSDLRESGSIEQDADIVMFIYRDEYYYHSEEEWIMAHPDREYPRGEADVIIAKHRNGATGRLKLRFVHNLAKFEDLGFVQPLL
jgi:replicative DNA helicase